MTTTQDQRFALALLACAFSVLAIIVVGSLLNYRYGENTVRYRDCLQAKHGAADCGKVLQ